MSAAVPHNLHTKARPSAAFAVGLGLTCAVAATDVAQACRAHQWWRTGEDVSKLRDGEIAVKAKLIESYKGEQAHDSIMGYPFGAIFYVQITEVIGSHPSTKEDFSEGASVYIRRRPSVCEAYSPRNFAPNTEKLLVLRRGPTGLYDLVGGQD